MAIEEYKKPTLLLHVCCAPCSTHSIEILEGKYDLTLFWYNPCIYPHSEYLKRKEEYIRYAKIKDIPFEIIEEDEEEYLKEIKGHEKDREGEKRCEICFRQRLERTADFAESRNFDYFATTLTISPHKNSTTIFDIGHSVARQLSVKFLPKDFKSDGGFYKSVELSKKHNLYRQDYCGCRFSIRR